MSAHLQIYTQPIMRLVSLNLLTKTFDRGKYWRVVCASGASLSSWGIFLAPVLMVPFVSRFVSPCSWIMCSVAYVKIFWV